MNFRLLSIGSRYGHVLNLLDHYSDLVIAPNDLKTGTLTADTQALSKLVSKLPNSKRKISPSFQRFILAGCHSLIQLKTASGSQGRSGTVVGDPLDLSALKFSGWKYNQTADCYSASNSNSKRKSDPVRLWQIKTFPFDPNKRLSSALVLAQSADKKFSLWRLTKGSTETMNALYSQRDDAMFNQAYCKKTQELEAHGYRSIALGVEDLSSSSLVVDHLFPNGISNDDEILRHARARGSLLHRSDFEAGKEGGNATVGLEFYGFSCFDASLRPSSRRVIDELHRGGINAIMLTGDAIDAALAVAGKVGLVKESNVAILETKEGTDGEVALNWRIVKLQPGKDASFKTLHELARMEDVTMSSVKDILKRQRRGDYSIAATGCALELVLNEGSGNALKLLLAENLSRVSVIARATPNLKKSVIICLKRCGQKVLMCGE
jgi:magnesium-transporting ATPase (P-type)